MKKQVFDYRSIPGVLTFSICFIFLLFLGCNQQKKEDKPVQIIFDSDISPDYDDVGAIAILHAFADSGLANILATVTSNKYYLTAPVLEVFNTYFGRPHIPIGAPKSQGANQECWQKWADTIVVNYPHHLKSTDDAQDAVIVYRKILSKAEDTSVVIVTVGFLTNLKNLLISNADSFSNLSGLELVKKKVNHLVCMAGCFPSGMEYNVRVDSASSKYVFDCWPSKIIFTGAEIGSKVHTGLKLLSQPGISPVKDAFRISIPKSKEDSLGRCSWDETAVLIAVKGTSPYFKTVRGKIIVHPNGSNEWENHSDGLDEYVTLNMPIEQLASVLEKLMMHKPNTITK